MLVPRCCCPQGSRCLNRKLALHRSSPPRLYGPSDAKAAAVLWSPSRRGPRKAFRKLGNRAHRPGCRLCQGNPAQRSPGKGERLAARQPALERSREPSQWVTPRNRKPWGCCWPQGPPTRCRRWTFWRGRGQARCWRAKPAARPRNSRRRSGKSLARPVARRFFPAMTSRFLRWLPALYATRPPWIPFVPPTEKHPEDQKRTQGLSCAVLGSATKKES